MIPEKIYQIAEIYINARYKKTPAGWAITSGLSIFVILFGFDFAGSVGIDFSGFVIEGVIKSSDAPIWLRDFLFGLAVCLIVVGLVWVFLADKRQRKREAEEINRKVVLVVQIDAYNEVIPSSLVKSVPDNIIGQRLNILIQKHEAIIKGACLRETVEDLMHIKRQLLQNAGGRNLEDISICVGGLAPVPLLFIVGNIIEDDRPVYWGDWDRIKSEWVWSCQGRFVQAWGVPNLDCVCAEEIVLRSGITYPISEKDAAQAFHGMPMVTWEPKDKIFQVIIDEVSCQNICNDFKVLLHTLLGKGVKRINFLLAASSALAMRLGSSLDPRNMPEVIVYQFERNNEIVYPWGLGVRIHEGRKHPIIIDRRL